MQCRGKVWPQWYGLKAKRKVDNLLEVLFHLVGEGKMVAENMCRVILFWDECSKYSQQCFSNCKRSSRVLTCGICSTSCDLM